MTEEFDWTDPASMELRRAGQVPAASAAVLEEVHTIVRRAAAAESLRADELSQRRRVRRRRGIAGLVAAAAVCGAVVLPTMRFGDTAPVQSASAMEFLQLAAARQAGQDRPGDDGPAHAPTSDPLAGKRYWHLRSEVTSIFDPQGIVASPSTLAPSTTSTDLWISAVGTRWMSFDGGAVKAVCQPSGISPRCIKVIQVVQPALPTSKGDDGARSGKGVKESSRPQARPSVSATDRILGAVDLLAGPPLRGAKQEAFMEYLTDIGDAKLGGEAADSQGRRGTVIEASDGSYSLRLLIADTGRPLELTVSTTRELQVSPSFVTVADGRVRVVPVSTITVPTNTVVVRTTYLSADPTDELSP